MKLLLIEDNAAYASDLRNEIEDLGTEVVVARSRNSAFEALKEQSFDLIICDLDLPATDDDLDTNTAHGEAVRSRAEAEAPGTPIIVHSAFGTIPYLEDLIRSARTEDVYGTGNRAPLVSSINKDDLPRLVGEVARVRDELRALRDIEIVIDDVGLELDHHEARTLAIFGRRQEGRRIDVVPLAGGLSGARVLRVRVRGDAGTTEAAVVAKVDELPAVLDEVARFRRFVGPVLGFGRFPHLADEVASGAGSKGAIFYSVAEEYDRSLFGVLEESPDRGATLVERTREVVRRWEEHAPLQTLTVGDVRRLHLADDRVAPEAGALARELEQRRVQVRSAVQHGDLHGENLLFNRDLYPAIIDFGNICNSLTGYDPIALELSLVFHPEGRKRCGGWPSAEEARRWADVDAYVENCPYGEFVRACRTWAGEVAAGPRSVLAGAFAHVVKQFQYPDTSKEVASAILGAILSGWDS